MRRALLVLPMTLAAGLGAVHAEGTAEHADSDTSSILAQLEALVGIEGDDRVVELARFLEHFDEPADLRIDERYHSVISAAADVDLLFGKVKAAGIDAELLAFEAGLAL